MKINLKKTFTSSSPLGDGRPNLSIRLQSLNITINDSKKMVTMFGGKYIQFLMRNKGSTIKSKNDLIVILNRKPRSFLNRLSSLITNFKNYDSKLTRNLISKKIHPRKLITLSKTGSSVLVNSKNIKKETIQNLTLLPKNTKSNSFASINNSNLNSSKIINKKYDLLISKINILNKSLKNNKLPMPLNLLKPLLNVNLKSTVNSNLGSLAGEKNNKVSLFKNKIDPIKNFKNSITNISKLIPSLNEPLFFKLPQNGKNIVYKSKINKFKELINKYNANDISNITYTKYFQLITAYKSVNPFNQNIVFNFNKYNNINIKNIATLLDYAFRSMSCLISKPVFMVTADNIIINLFYFFIPGKIRRVKRSKQFFASVPKGLLRARNILMNNKSLPIAKSLNGILIPKNRNFKFSKKNQFAKMKWQFLNKQFLTYQNTYKLNKLCTILSRIFNKPVKLDLIPLSLPFFDDNILVKAIAILSKKINIRKIFQKIYRNTRLYTKITANYRYSYAFTKSYLAGIKIKIGGRLMTQRIIPKKTSRVMQRGPIVKGKVTFVD
jgi:Mitochondrial ribosomal protein (VAR1)